MSQREEFIRLVCAAPKEVPSWYHHEPVAERPQMESKESFAARRGIQGDAMYAFFDWCQDPCYDDVDPAWLEYWHLVGEFHDEMDRWDQEDRMTRAAQWAVHWAIEAHMLVNDEAPVDE